MFEAIRLEAIRQAAPQPAKKKSGGEKRCRQIVGTISGAKITGHPMRPLAQATYTDTPRWHASHRIRFHRPAP